MHELFNLLTQLANKWDEEGEAMWDKHQTQSTDLVLGSKSVQVCRCANELRRLLCDYATAASYREATNGPQPLR